MNKVLSKYLFNCMIANQGPHNPNLKMNTTVLLIIPKLALFLNSTIFFIAQLGMI